MIEVLGYIRGDNTGWGINVSKIRWGDDPTTLNIRNVNEPKDIISKGITISDYEASLLADLLVRNDYGSVEELKEAIKRREFFTDYGEIVNENEQEEDVFVFRIKQG